MSGKCPTCGAPSGPTAPDGDFRYTSPVLREPARTKQAAALDIAREALRIIALPQGEENALERMMRRAAEKALRDIATLVPEARDAR